MMAFLLIILYLRVDSDQLLCPFCALRSARNIWLSAPCSRLADLRSSVYRITRAALRYASEQSDINE